VVAAAVAAAVATAIVAADRGAGIVVDLGGLGRGADDRGSDRVVTALWCGVASFCASLLAFWTYRRWGDYAEATVLLACAYALGVASFPMNAFGFLAAYAIGRVFWVRWVQRIK
jgi:hypothetical protein